ncbi:MAG: hypothetical protein QOI24_1054 [Acidobacteriota bacterium]|nr:hypothetical protein [Acidobacteriota bacterium]
MRLRCSSGMEVREIRRAARADPFEWRLFEKIVDQSVVLVRRDREDRDEQRKRNERRTANEEGLLHSRSSLSRTIRECIRLDCSCWPLFSVSK